MCDRIDGTGIGHVWFMELFRPFLQVSWKVAGFAGFVILRESLDVLSRGTLFCSTTVIEVEVEVELALDR